MFKAAEGPLNGILGYEDRALVSTNDGNDPRSSIVDAPSTMVVTGRKVSFHAGYDNEWTMPIAWLTWSAWWRARFRRLCSGG